MKLHLLSDTHGTPITPHPEADLIVHAGDFGNGRSGAQAFQAACHRAGKPCLFVLGNHDYYGENIDELPRELIAADAPLLTENRIIEFGGWTFVGGTLFSKGTPTKPLTTNKTAAASSSTRWATRTKSDKTATVTACCWNCPISQRQPENGFSRFQAAFKRFCYFQRRRFAAYHEQGQAPAPRATSTFAVIFPIA